MNRRLLFLFLLLPSLPIGCGPAVSREELGTVSAEVPAFDSFEQKFPLPKLGPEPEETPEETPADEPAKE